MRTALLATLAALLAQPAPAAGPARPVPLKARVEGVQPWTGIVLWSTSEHNRADAIQLEFRYVRYDEVVRGRGDYDWVALDRVLDAVAGRGHQAILRFYDAYPGKENPAPAYLKALPDYRETKAPSEGKPTGFPDWSHPEQKRFALDFFDALARRYDDDPRLAYLQVGFGLWSEYHIYDGPMELGRTFPDLDFQAEFHRSMARAFRRTPWMISIDAADADRTPFATRRELLDLPFGLFDDSFLSADRQGYNARSWAFFGRDRWKTAPAGGEFSYYTERDQRLALSPEGPHGRPFERAAQDYHVTFMIGDAQPRHAGLDRVRAAGMACGYRFGIRAFETDGQTCRVVVTNLGVAPPYHDAFVAVDGVRAEKSLRGLLPGEERAFEVAAGGEEPRLTIESDRLVPGQRIGFEADLP